MDSISRSVLEIIRFLFTGIILTMLAPNTLSADPGSTPPRPLKVWGVQGSGPGEFDFPIGIVVTPEDQLLVTDFYNARLQRFSLDGKFIESLAVLPNPGAITLDQTGNIYLSHFSAIRIDEEKKPSRISVYDPKGQLLRTWGETGKAEGEFDYPGGLAISADKRLYVADQTNHRVQVFELSGKYLFQWGRYGVAPGEFGGNTVEISRVGGPQFIALDSSGNVFTTEGSVCRIQKFTPDGKYLASFGDNLDQPGSFGGEFPVIKSPLIGPISLCFDHEQKLWISSVSGRIQQFSPEGKYLRSIDNGAGSEPGQFLAPHMLATDRHRHLYIVDSYNHRIQKFDIAP